MKVFYSWLNENEIKPKLVQTCMKSWEKGLVGHEIINLNHQFIKENNIKSKYLDKVLELNMNAFASDYLRFYSLHKYGGMYIDSDVAILGDISDLFELPTYISREGLRSVDPNTIEAAVLYFKEKNHHLLRHTLNLYDQMNVDSMTREEIKGEIAPYKMYEAGFRVNSISHPKIIHNFMGSWQDI